MKRDGMKRKNIIYIMGIVLAVVLIGLFSLKSDTEPVNGMIIFTQVFPGTTDYDADKARIVAITPENDKPEILSEGFYAARSPVLSSDARYILFAGKKTMDEPWQIWKMNISSNETEKVFKCKVDCTDPAFLPDGQILYSKMVNVTEDAKGFALFTCNSDGEEHKQITFHPHDDLLSTIMQDGRILFISKQQHPSASTPQLMAMRPNGSKIRLFYLNQNNSWPISRGKETKDGKMVFIESSNANEPGGSLVSISLTRPLHSHELLNNDARYHSVYPLKSGKMIVSCKENNAKTFELWEFDPESKKREKLIFSDPDYWSVEPIAVYARQRPKKLPDELNYKDMTGRVLCLDANNSNMPSLNRAEEASKGTAIQVMGIDGIWGEVPLEEDGSFLLRVTANKALQFRTVNEAGEVVRGPSAWIWLSPHERRGCVGCHEDPEMTPKNVEPMAVKNLPVEVMAPDTQEMEKMNKKSEKKG